MGILWLKNAKDAKSFNIAKNLGFEVYEITNLEKTDDVIAQLVKQNYNTIIVSNEIANFSEDILIKYKKRENLNVIIAPKNF